MDQAERDKLVLDNQRLAHWATNKVIRSCHVDPRYHEEMHDEALVALVQAADTWNPAKSKFTTWVALKVRQAAIGYLRRTADDYRPVKLPRTARTKEYRKWRRDQREREYRRKYSLYYRLDIGALKRAMLARGVIF